MLSLNISYLMSVVVVFFFLPSTYSKAHHFHSTITIHRISNLYNLSATTFTNGSRKIQKTLLPYIVKLEKAELVSLLITHSNDLINSFVLLFTMPGRGSEGICSHAPNLKQLCCKQVFSSSRLLLVKKKKTECETELGMIWQLRSNRNIFIYF